MTKKSFKITKFTYLFMFIALFSSISIAVDGNINNDTKVNLDDLSIMAENWLNNCSNPSWCNGADINADNIVNMQDYAMLATNWNTDSSLVGWWKMDGPTPGQNIRFVKDYSIYGNNGTMGSSDAWIAGGGLNFSGGDGTSGIAFANVGAGLIADMGLDKQVTISFIMSGHTAGDKGYAFSGKNSANAHIMSMEAPTGDTRHFLTKMGTGDTNWMWDVFNPNDYRYIFAESDSRRIAVTVDFDSGAIIYYLDGAPWGSFNNAVGSFTSLVSFTIGRQLHSEYDCSMEDFRIYNRVLSQAEIDIISTPKTASQLIPADGKVAAATEDGDVTLYWKPGLYTNAIDGHDIYFGTNYNSVNNATTASAEYKGTQTTTSYDLSSLNKATTYYWRIDQNAGANVYKGNVHSFTISDVWLMDFVNTGYLSTADRICAYTIQGLMNQKGARVFLNHRGHNMGNSTADDYWIGYLEDEKGFTFANIGSLRELVAAARNEGVISGLTKYNPANIDTGEVTVAVNLAVGSNYVPVTAEMLNYASKGLQYKGYIDCFEGLAINDISGTWATKLAAQSYGVTNLMPGTPKNGVFSCIRSFTTFEDVHNYDNGIDYGIQRKFYAYDMNYSQTGTERTLFNSVMNHLVKPGMSFGSWHDEDIDLAGVSAAGNYTILYGLNLSFWANVGYNPANLNMSRAKSDMTLDPTKHYVMFQTSEGDTAAYLTGLQMSGKWLGSHGAWLKANRGKGKVTWCTLPVAYDLWPALLEYYNTTTEPNDSFWTGPSGAGYTRVSSLPNIPDWAALTDSYVYDLGITGVEVWWGFSLGMYETFKAYAPHVKGFSHQGVAGGSNDWLKDGTPIVRSNSPADRKQGTWYAELADPNDIVTNITNFGSTKAKPYFIAVYDVPDKTVDYAAICEDQLGSDYVIVNGVDFIDLMDQMVHPKPWGTLLTYDDFEIGFGNWTDGGGGCARYTGGITYARLGTCSINLRNHNGDASSMYHTNGIDVLTPGYTHIKVTFWFKADSIETGEALNVEYYDGSTWQILARYIRGTNMENGIFYRKTIDIYKGTYNFPTNMKLKFRSDASDDYDNFYIDCVTVEAK